MNIEDSFDIYNIEGVICPKSYIYNIYIRYIYKLRGTYLPQIKIQMGISQKIERKIQTINWNDPLNSVFKLNQKKCFHLIFKQIYPKTVIL